MVILGDLLSLLEERGLSRLLILKQGTSFLICMLGKGFSVSRCIKICMFSYNGETLSSPALNSGNHGKVMVFHK